MNVRLAGSFKTNAMKSINTYRNVYLHKGPRVAGLKRDPEEVFVTRTGHQYGTAEENLKEVKLFLSLKYAISDDMVLQVLTHKSFGNGIKPYNEKLSALGSKVLNLYMAKYVIDHNTTNELSINGKNLDVLGTPMSKELSGRMAVGLFAKSSKVNNVMFWNSYNQGLGFETSGEMKVSAQMMYALIGAVTFSHGKQIAEEFIKERFLGGEKPTLEDITVLVVEKK